ncbi:MAG: DUF349 domain-containing protein [Bacteroidales bacterium]|nr:DUF349 domain-containing protein [Bacteroidales bacterium]
MIEKVNPEQINEEIQSEVADYSGKSLSELSELFQQFATSAERLQNSKEAEALKSAFYKTLAKEKEKLEESAQNVFDAVEENFKALYTAFKKEKAEYMKQLDAQKEANLKAKQAVIEDLKALLEKDEDVTATFPAFRDIQNRWREIGAVPVQAVRDINQTYHLYVEQFYDKLDINRELRDLDFKKNHEAKTELCKKAEELTQNENVIEAFRELQKLHDAWKDLGPVAKQYREEIWENFKASTAIINKKYQAYFEGLKEEQAANLEAKAALCEKVEAIAEQEIEDSKLWNSLSKDIEAIQAEWRKIGFATKKENQKIYDRFRAACDKFYERKREFYSEFKNDMEENLQKKLAICVEAEELKLSKEWKKATDRFIQLQKEWKEIGAVPRKKSDAVWKRFRAACDEFFAEKEKAMKAQKTRFAKKTSERVVSEKDRLIAKYRSLEQEISTKENNILFFATGTANALLDSMRKGIDSAKKELAELEQKIREMEAAKQEKKEE